jgi:hypothetical protein
MRKLRKRRKAETFGVASEPGVASTSRVAQAMDIDTNSEQSTHSQTESEDKTPGAIHSFYYLCNKYILIHKTFISFHISTRI